MNGDENLLNLLVKKYDVQVPRYTSYPTIPVWNEKFSLEDFHRAVESSNNSDARLSLYIHVPFCKNPCYYCACNKVIDSRNIYAEDYVSSLINEINFKSKKFINKKVSHMHFGGGTPTYLSESQLERLLKVINEKFNINNQDDREFSIELDPRSVSEAQLYILKDFEFKRFSIGVQDFNPDVQKAINRIQSFELVKNLVEFCRKKISAESINFDLIYGLPYQTEKSFSETIDLVLALEPDRIALFNYAHLPSIQPLQKIHINSNTLPIPEIKLSLFLLAIEKLCSNGYEYIGLDHFAKNNDKLAIARHEGKLHRNFQGYTVQHINSFYLLGLGATSISDFGSSYHQNKKDVKEYMNNSLNNIFEFERGYFLTPRDIETRELIMRLLCDNKISVKISNSNILEKLKDFQTDGLISLEKKEKEIYELIISQLGKVFSRNIASVFDEYLTSSKSFFSRSI